MAFEHYLIVRDSDLYEYKGLTKSVLMTIALLIIAEPEEDERGKTQGECDPDAGWCVAGQNYIAAGLGMSPDAVSSSINIIKKDGYLEVITRRNRYGHLKNKYRIPAYKLEEIKARARKKDESGNFVRAKQETKARNLPRGKHGAFLTAGRRKGSSSGQAYGGPMKKVPSPQVDARPLVTVQQGLTASCGSPQGTEPSSVGFSEFHQQVPSSGQARHDDNTDASLDHFVETRETLDPKPQTADNLLLLVHPPAPQAIDVPPAPPAHYTHKWSEWENSRGKLMTSCEWCACMRNSNAASNPCRPDKERCRRS